ncbi:hypothetical protein OIO90_001844 [Microbotryomycetes sp. JL221]|nr:hypothetical protein OIO90_001844 [Microbotryomycetes sp. JL221]
MEKELPCSKQQSGENVNHHQILKDGGPDHGAELTAAQCNALENANHDQDDNVRGAFNQKRQRLSPQQYPRHGTTETQQRIRQHEQDDRMQAALVLADRMMSRPTAMLAATASDESVVYVPGVFRAVPCTDDKSGAQRYEQLPSDTTTPTTRAVSLPQIKGSCGNLTWAPLTSSPVERPQITVPQPQLQYRTNPTQSGQFSFELEQPRSWLSQQPPYDHVQQSHFPSSTHSAFTVLSPETPLPFESQQHMQQKPFPSVLATAQSSDARSHSKKAAVAMAQEPKKRKHSSSGQTTQTRTHVTHTENPDSCESQHTAHAKRTKGSSGIGPSLSRFTDFQPSATFLTSSTSTLIRIEHLLNHQKLLPSNWTSLLELLIQEGEETLTDQRRGASSVAEFFKWGKEIHDKWGRIENVRDAMAAQRSNLCNE